MKNLKTYGLLLTSYFLLAILFTWPLATRLTTHGFGHDEDAPYHIWHNWWFKFSLFDLKQNPLKTDYIFHPQKVNLIYDANAFVFSALTLPLQFLTGNVILASNLIFLLSFVLSGLFAFLLAKRLTLSAFPAFIVGVIFAFNPYTTAQALDGHINLTSTWMIPLYTLLLLKSLSPVTDKDQRAKIKEQKWTGWLNLSIAAGLVAALQLYNDFTYTAFLMIETALVFLFCLYANRQRLTATMIHITVTGIFIGTTATVLSAPILLEVIKVSREGFRVGSPLWVQNVWSADLLTFIRPNDQTTFLDNPWTPNIGTVEGTAFIGYTVLGLLMAYGLWRIAFRKKPPHDSSANDPVKGHADLGNHSRQWSHTENLMIFLSVSFFVLMLGPSLHYHNRFVFRISDFDFILPLPYLLLHKIPFVGETQEPTRMFPFFILPASILVAVTLKKITEKFPRRLSFLLLASYFLLLIYEYLPLPFPTTDLSPNPVFEMIRNDPEKKSVLVLPLGFNSGNYVLGQSPLGSLQFYQVYHQKPSFRATVARLPYSYFEYYQKLPLLPFLLDPSKEPRSEDLDKESVPRVFRNQLGIKYILVFENKYKRPIGRTHEMIEKILGAQKFYDANGVKGYKLN